MLQLRKVYSIPGRILPKIKQILPITGLAAAASLLLSSPALAEGSYQTGLNQPLYEYSNPTSPLLIDTNRPLYVDIRTPGEVINISVCGQASTDDLRVEIYNSFGTQVFTRDLTDSNVSCTNSFTAPLTTPLRYTTTAADTYEVRLHNLTVTDGVFNLFDITVTPNATTNPNPSVAQGRVWAYSWAFNAGTFAATGATNADYFALVPGGRLGTNYVWRLDLNNFAGFIYEIIANDIGLNPPYSGLSAAFSASPAPSVSLKFPIYLGYPVIANPPPATPPNISNFRFIDDAGVDSTISPTTTGGVQDKGSFQFTTDVNGTYAIVIDTTKDGIYGTGDTLLLGNAVSGSNSIQWDGKNNSGNQLPTGTYTARLQVRVGEYHFVAGDAETSGGTEQGLTIFQALSGSSSVDTQVYWDDQTLLGGTSTLPTGQPSSSAAGRHTWGDFTGTGFGNERYIDTYVYGLANLTTTPATIANTDIPDLTIAKTHTGNFTQGATGTYTITATNSGGQASSGVVTVSDPLPSGLTPTAASGTGWNCTISGQTVTCTRSDALAVNSSYPPISLSVAVASNAAVPSITNIATIAGGGQTNTSNDTASHLTPITASAPPNLRLVKRITAINAVNISGFVDYVNSSDPRAADDNALNWPDSDPNPAINTYLRGAVNGGFVKPGDTVEYTIYFLSDGGKDTTNVQVCDLVPANTTFISNAFNGLNPTDGGLPGTDLGIAIALSSTSVPTQPTAYLTNVPDPDRGRFFAPGTTPPTACSSSNNNGAVVVNVVTNPTTLPKSTASGTPSNSYGFIRFRVRVN